MQAAYYSLERLYFFLLSFGPALLPAFLCTHHIFWKEIKLPKPSVLEFESLWPQDRHISTDDNIYLSPLFRITNINKPSYSLLLVTLISGHNIMVLGRLQMNSERQHEYTVMMNTQKPKLPQEFLLFLKEPDYIRRDHGPQDRQKRFTSRDAFIDLYFT